MLRLGEVVSGTVRTPGVVRGSLRDPDFMWTHSEQMYRIRYEVFHERLRWDVTVSDGMERDRFDDADSVYMATTDISGAVSGGWRLRPTTRDYMLSDIFSQLLHGNPIFRDRRVWEISRFAVDTKDRATTAAFSIGETARLLLVDATRFAIEQRISQYVLVTSVAVERLLASTGIALHRYGPPVRIGRVMSVACSVDIDAHTRAVLLEECQPLRLAA